MDEVREFIHLPSACHDGKWELRLPAEINAQRSAAAQTCQPPANYLPTTCQLLANARELFGTYKHDLPVNYPSVSCWNSTTGLVNSNQPTNGPTDPPTDRLTDQPTDQPTRPHPYPHVVSWDVYGLLSWSANSKNSASHSYHDVRWIVILLWLRNVR